MDGTGRTFVPVAGTDAWLRCAHSGTALDRSAEVVTLAAVDEPPPGWGDPETAGEPPEPAGLAFDPAGCLYHGDPERGQVQRVAGDGGVVDLLAPPAAPGGGGFTPVGPEPGLAVRPVALAADPDEHLFVLDGATGLVHVLDLGDGHLVRTIPLPRPPVDLAADGRTIVVATADRAHPLVEVDALGLPLDVDPAGLAGLDAVPPAAVPARVAVGPGGERWLLLRDGTSAWAVPVADPRTATPIRVDGATDLELDGDGRVVVGGPAGADLRRFTVASEDGGLRARRYDGRGIVRTPDGGIGFWMAGGGTATGFRLAVPGRRRFVPAGHVDCFALDGGAYGRQWGRVFVEACVPVAAEVRVAFVASDDEPDPLEQEGPSIARTPPADDVPGGPPLPPAVPPLVAQRRAAELGATWPLHRRETGSELPWVRPVAGDRFEVYEAPVQAGPGRYLWVRVELRGTTAVAPRVRAVRVEVPGHDLLERLPKAYRRDAAAASFLRRYLAMADGLLAEMEARAARRDLVLDPFGAPAEVLPWLASLVGLTLDDRWPEQARRTMLAEAVCLFRKRGTVAGLSRMLEIYLGTPVVVVEAFRFRGTGGGLAGGAGGPGGTATAVVGHGFRVGGELGDPTEQPLTGSVADAFATHAHRFSVIVRRDLDDEQLETVHHLLDLHRPAHTLVEVCAVGRGMRVGLGLHVGLSTAVGPGSGFRPAVLGQSRLGTTAVLGKPRAGVRVGGSRVAGDMVVDP